MTWPFGASSTTATSWPSGNCSLILRGPPDHCPTGRIDLTMAFVGTRAMFEQAGFAVVGTTDAVASKLPRLIMRRTI